MRFIITILLTAALVLGVAYLLPGVTVASFGTAILVALLLGLINAFVRPIVSLLALPLTIMTLGLFQLVVNGAMVLLVDYFLPGFTVANIWWGILFVLLLALFNGILGNTWKGDK